MIWQRGELAIQQAASGLADVGNRLLGRVGIRHLPRSSSRPPLAWPWLHWCFLDRECRGHGVPAQMYILGHCFRWGEPEPVEPLPTPMLRTRALRTERLRRQHDGTDEQAR